MKFAYYPNFATEIVINALKEKLVENKLEFITTSAEDIQNAFKENRADMGFISPLQYAQLNGQLRICKEVVLSSPQMGKNILLFFQKNLKSIDRIYYQKSKTSEYQKFMADIILNEIFDLIPEWVGLEKIKRIDLDLKKYPAILMTGDSAFDSLPLIDTYIDLSEEWILKNEKPFVHMLLVAQNGIDVREEIRKLALSRDIGLKNITKIESNYCAAIQPTPYLSYSQFILNYYSFEPSEAIWQSLAELLQYFFYYSFTEYLQELNFYDESSFY